MQKEKNKKLEILLILSVLLTFEIYGLALNHFSSNITDEGLEADVLGASTVRGVVYDWQMGKVLNNFEKTDTMPSPYFFAVFDSEEATDSPFGFWTKAAEPGIGSRDLQAGDVGEDVIALQGVMNLLRTDNRNDRYFFEQLEINGIFDEPTVSAVKSLQGFFDLEQTGNAGFETQSLIYKYLLNLDLEQYEKN